MKEYRVGSHTVSACSCTCGSGVATNLSHTQTTYTWMNLVKPVPESCSL